jgi:hypothetical protein
MTKEYFIPYFDLSIPILVNEEVQPWLEKFTNQVFDGESDHIRTSASYSTIPGRNNLFHSIKSISAGF